MNDHDLEWLISLLKMRLDEMRPKERTLNLKLCRAGAKKLLHNLMAARDAARKAVNQ